MSNKMTLWQVLQSVDAGTASSATQTAVNALRAVVKKTQPFGAKTTGNSELAAIVEAIESANDVGKLPNGLSWVAAPEWATRLYCNPKGELIWMGPFGDERFKFAYVGGHHWFSSDDRAFSRLLEIVATRPQVVEQITADQTTSSKPAADCQTQSMPAMECRQRPGTVCTVNCQCAPAVHQDSAEVIELKVRIELLKSSLSNMADYFAGEVQRYTACEGGSMRVFAYRDAENRARTALDSYRIATDALKDCSPTFSISPTTVQPLQSADLPEPTILIDSGWVDLSRVQDISLPDAISNKFTMQMVSGVKVWGDATKANYDNVVSVWRAIRRRAVWGK